MKKVLLLVFVGMLVGSATYGATGFGVFGSVWDAKDPDDMGLGGGLKFKMEMAPNICLELFMVVVELDIMLRRNSKLMT